MNVSLYTYLMNKPDAITEKQAEALGSILNEFPYFQSARALRLKGLFNQNSFKYNYALKVTAAHTTDRSVLFDFITSESFTSIQNEFYDDTIRDLSDITVYGSEIVRSEEFKKNIEVVVPVDPVEQSILDSIKEATGAVFNETIKPGEQPIEPSGLNTEKEIETIVEKPIIIEERPVESKSFLVDAPVFYEEPPVTEEKPAHQIIEQAVVTAQEEVPVALEIDKKQFHPAGEPDIIAVPDITTVVWEEVQKSVEVEIDPIIEEPSLTLKETAEIVFEEVQKTDEVTIDLIEESDIISVPDTTAVVWEEPKEVSANKKSNITDEAQINEPVKKAEENLEIGKPLDFTPNEKHSFQEWLQLARTEAIDRSVNVTKKSEKETEKTPEPIIQAPVRTESVDEQKRKKEEIINNFIKTNPKIPPIKPTAIVPAVQLDSNNQENSYLMTETLARVYLEQKKYTKAIQAYEILILKYPEKISFFADRISDIKILQQNNNNN